MIGSPVGRALPSLATQARPSTITDHPLVGLMDIDVHLLGRTGPTPRMPLLDILEEHLRGEIPSRYDVGLPDDGTGVDFGIAAVIPVSVADMEV